MKLLVCEQCQDLFKLDYKVRSCKCGRVRGRYNEDGHTAVVNGKGYSLGLGNGSLFNGIAKGFTGPYKSEIMIWYREHEGPNNPRSTVDPEVGLGGKNE